MAELKANVEGQVGNWANCSRFDGLESNCLRAFHHLKDGHPCMSANLDAICWDVLRKLYLIRKKVVYQAEWKVFFELWFVIDIQAYLGLP
jgi:hypothetical protein